MVQIATLLLAGPLGLLYANRRRGLGVYLVVAAVVVLPIQTISINSDSPDDINAGYWVIQGLTFAIGVGLHALGARLRERRGSNPALPGAGEAR